MIKNQVHCDPLIDSPPISAVGRDPPSQHTAHLFKKDGRESVARTAKPLEYLLINLLATWNTLWIELFYSAFFRFSSLEKKCVWTSPLKHQVHQSSSHQRSPCHQDEVQYSFCWMASNGQEWLKDSTHPTWEKQLVRLMVELRLFVSSWLGIGL